MARFRCIRQVDEVLKYNLLNLTYLEGRMFGLDKRFRPPWDGFAVILASCARVVQAQFGASRCIKLVGFSKACSQEYKSTSILLVLLEMPLIATQKSPVRSPPEKHSLVNCFNQVGELPSSLKSDVLFYDFPLIRQNDVFAVNYKGKHGVTTFPQPYKLTTCFHQGGGAIQTP